MTETGITLTVYCDLGYKYEISDDEFLQLTYVEDRESGDYRINLSFGSIEEMEEVAKAMLKVAQLKRELE